MSSPASTNCLAAKSNFQYALIAILCVTVPFFFIMSTVHIVLLTTKYGESEKCENLCNAFMTLKNKSYGESELRNDSHILCKSGFKNEQEKPNKRKKYRPRMKYKYKADKPLKRRKQAAMRVLKEFSGYLPVVVEKDPGAQLAQYSDVLEPTPILGKETVADFKDDIESKIKASGIYLYVNDGLISTEGIISDLYDKYHEKDNNLYVVYSDIPHSKFDLRMPEWTSDIYTVTQPTKVTTTTVLPQITTIIASPVTTFEENAKTSHTPMKFKYKKNKPFEDRKIEADKAAQTLVYLPVVIEKDPGALLADYSSTNKPEPMLGTKTIEDLSKDIKNKLKESAIYLYVNDKLILPNETISSLHGQYHEKDNILYIAYSDIDNTVFGSRMPMPSSKVYTDISVRHLPHIIITSRTTTEIPTTTKSSEITTTAPGTTKAAHKTSVKPLDIKILKLPKIRITSMFTETLTSMTATKAVITTKPFKTLMNYEYKKNKPIENRKNEADNIVKVRVYFPVVIEKDPGALLGDYSNTNKPESMLGTKTIEDLSKDIKNKLKESAIYLYVNDKLISPNETISSLHDKYHEEDNILYIAYSDIDDTTFGSRIPMSSSNVYTDVSVRNLPHIIITSRTTTEIPTTTKSSEITTTAPGTTKAAHKTSVKPVELKILELPKIRITSMFTETSTSMTATKAVITTKPFKTLMNYEYKKNKPIENRKNEADNIVKVRVYFPVVIEKDPGALLGDYSNTNKPESMLGTKTIEDLSKDIKNKLKESAIYLYVNDKLISPNETISSLHDKYHEEDNILYIAYSDIDDTTFGSRIPMSSSNVYTDVSVRNLPHIIITSRTTTEIPTTTKSSEITTTAPRTTKAAYKTSVKPLELTTLESSNIRITEMLTKTSTSMTATKAVRTTKSFKTDNVVHVIVYVPVVIEKDPGSLLGDYSTTNKPEPILGNKTIEDLSKDIKKKLKESAIYLYVNDTLISPNETISSLYERYREKDNNLYIVYSDINDTTFGPRISTSKSEVYLQTEFSRTAPTTTATLLTSSESFITELTSTARSHTEIKKPTLTKAAFTTTSSETKLLEATTELPPEKLPSAKVTTRTAITEMPTTTKTVSLETTLPKATTESLTEKLLSTEVTATSTITGMLTTAAVPTERTSFKPTSVLLTDELTSATAITTSPITAVPKVTASISLSTTTVTAEAYETLMKYSYKEENPLENRITEAANILRDNLDYVPVVIEKDPGSSLANYRSTNKPEPVMGNKTIEDLTEEIQNKINEDIVYLYVNDTLISPNETISSLYDHYHDKDNILYIAYSDINDTTFGPRIPKSSSEVYLQTESPTTAPTTTGRLLTSSESFITELTSTGRSHTEIKTPKLTTTASTTTESSETKLFEGTTESLPGKLSSTKLAASTTIVGMPTTAPVPTERTSLKSSVSLTEELTSTTAITPSPITAVPTITASISLPTTTVTAEAYETLMKYPYKEENPLENRNTEAADILRDNPDFVPVVIEKDPGSPFANYRSTNKPEPVMGNKTIEELTEEIQNKLNEDIVYLYVNDTLISPNETISSLYDHYHDKDNILYIAYSDINDTTFGPRIPKSSSEVYLQTESPTTAPTTTARLLTSSESFITELSSTGRSHTEIKTPKLTTTASTTTEFSETTLLEGTTESLPGKLTSTKLAASTTIIGSPTTAVVPTERTSLKSSVPPTEELTSTTAITPSPITAVPTTTATISLPTTTVAAEAYETLMKYPYKEENPLKNRKTEAADILRDNPDYVPVVIEKDPGSPFANYRSTNKPEPVMGNKTIEELTEEIQNKLNEDIIYLYVNDTLISPNETISSLYDHYHDKDNILYIAYSDINDTTFGPRIPKSSSEVYLQTESPTTAPTATGRLLTSSESFITELTSTGRSHTEIKTPKLTTTASTTTESSETKLFEGTTESLPGKLSSTKLAASTTIIGTPTTAAVPTERTSLKSSVSLTEELTSTTAITPSPITAVPTITASISLPTTTVTAEAYETLMKYPYKEENPLENRKTEAADILRDNPDFVPVVIEKDPGSPLANYRSTNKPEPVMGNKTIEDLSEEIKNKINEDIIYLYVNDTLISPNETISSLYDHYHDKDNILYIAYSDINDTTFGPRIPKSSSEVYLQTESPTTAPTTTATLLTSSGSFSTEVTSTARSHTEIITPTLSTTASTTTPSSDTTLLAATTESLSEKLASTKSTAKTTITEMPTTTKIASLETTLPEATTESLTEKPSSTEVTATSTITGMPTTAAVPTERTSFKPTSVPPTEELTSTTAITPSPITAVPTTTATISLPTTTVAAEAYETLMKYPYKEENPLENRKTEAANILWDNPEYVPVVIEKDPGSPLANYRSTNKPEPVMGNKTIEDLTEEIQNKLKEDIIYLYVNDTLISPNETISSLYDHYHDKDNILYIAYSDINDTTFGPRIPKSSSEVYLQTESPTTAPTNTTTLLTSSETFSTEVTSTARSHTEIMTPTLTITASTTTASSKSTLLEATTESLTEKPSSTEVTATSTITGMSTTTKTASLETTLPEATTESLTEKPSSTGVTATSTITGMPTTAAVPTERTSLKSSVSLTEELTSTTAITASPITAMTTITASLSLPTTTVTAETYETLMKYPYKEENPLENRKTEAADILRDNPDYIPVVIEKDPGSPLANYRSTNKPEPVMGNKTIEELTEEIKNKINEDIIYLYVNDTLISPNETISSLYDHYHDKDNILYIAYSDINDTTFGPRIPKSSSEVYLQTESPTTAPTTTGRLLTTSESFITELTSTGRLHTEIMTPTLTITASTTTASSKSTLLEATTESLVEKLSSTKLTARTTITEMPTATKTASLETTLSETTTESLTEKPSSTEVTATSTITGISTTAAVPTERTSFRTMSVPLTEELTSTTASTITAAPTITAFISLPTTTVTAEAYETLMRYPYKEENPLENRKTEAADILRDNPDYVPVVIEKDPGSPLANYRSTNKPEPVMGNKTIEDLSEEIKNKINEDIIYLYVNDTLISPNETISSLYDHYHDKDNILYIAYSDINDTTFGPRIPKSSSEVYLQTESPTTAPATTATLLTSSGSFSTEVTSTARSHTEIITPTLSTTASTTTPSSDTTLLAATTESLSEKLASTKSTAKTTITEMPTTTKIASLETTLPEATTESLTEKPSSTEVTATSTITGMPTTAAVPTERTSFKPTSVPPTEELTSTTAITPSPITAVPTTTATISLPTTTVAAEAYETLMKYPYKEENPLKNRKTEAADILRDNPDYVPVVIEKDPGSPFANYRSTNKPEPVMGNKTIEELTEEIQNKLNEDIVYLYVNDTLISPNETISSLYDHYHDKDNILYIAYSDINDTTFGPRIPKSSSEVYLQTESPTTAPTTTARLLTSSESFITELTSTGRSHTEIKTPKLTTTASTTTESSKSTLLEATTESLVEKLSSTKLTARTTITEMPTATKTASLETTLSETTTESLTEKPSSTEVTATSTITGISTTAAVPTERTSFRTMSVPLTEELTSTTASTITAVPTITAFISLPTTTVTAEAYETLMRYPYKEENPLENRKTESANILRDNSEYVPVVIEKDPGSPLANYRSTNKPEPVMGNKTIEDLTEEIQNKINEDIIYLYVNDTLISPNETISSLYDHYHDKDNILYIAYSDINDTTFGPRISTSSSEVYLQTEFPTTAPTTTATLLTSSEAFITELTTVATSHIEIKTPTLTTAAATTTTISSETTLPEATTESFTEKPLSTEVTATSTITGMSTTTKTASLETTLPEATTESLTEKPSSTVVTATSTITGMPTTAAVPTERTSLKSSVSLTEELTSTTAITASPITAMTTITASLSLPTTTVTAEAYETLMKYPYKEENPLENRKTEAADILRDNPDYVPVVIEKDPGSPLANYRSTNKPEPVMGNKTIEDLSEEIKNKINEDIIYLYVNDTLISPNETISSLYDHYHDKDNILYIAYSDINDTTFGPRIFKSSSEVYLQTESPTTAATTTGRLLSSLEAFITELTTVATSYIEIKTPTLTTAAATTTTISSETTLPEGTRESLTEKPSSTEVTATSTITGMSTTTKTPSLETTLSEATPELLTEKPSSTGVTATSTITGMPTTAAVPTERTSLKSSVSLTEELTSTTAITASPITAMTTITASISLPTTTVAAEAYETLMKYPYKEENPLENRKTEAADILRDNPDFVPVVIEKDPGSPLANYRSTNKPEPVMGNKTIEDLSDEIKNKINEDIIYLYVNDTLISPNETISSLYDHYHDKDNILYIAYSDINDTTFGPRIPTSSSEVYLETESPTTAPTTTATLLTSSGSFSTEVTSTARSHTEIITPTLSTTASTTPSSETTLLAATTESLSEKLSSTKSTAKTTITEMPTTTKIASLETTLLEATTESLTEKPSSTEVTATSTITGMSTKAAVPTEQTSFRTMSVPLSEELSSTTASTITAVPTVTAFISLPTTTVTAEAYETLMRYPYKEENPFGNRKTEAADILRDNPDYVPVVIEKDPGSPLANYRSTNKPEPVMGNKTIEELTEEIKNKINEDIIYLYVNDTLISPNETISSLYDHYHDKDNILYIAYSDINDTTFGPRILKSSSEVYLQTESPTTAPTTTATLLTSSGSFSTEVTSTARSHTKIITPTLITTASTATASAETTLVEATTELPTEKLSSTEVTATSTITGMPTATKTAFLETTLPEATTEPLTEKPSSTEVTAASTLTGMPTTAAVPTERTLLKSSVPDTEELTPTTAITAYPITTVFTITASISLPTTTVTPEAYETLMKYPYKEENPLQIRKTEAADILRDNPDYIPVVIEKDPSSPLANYRSTNKPEPVMGNKTIEELTEEVQNKLNEDIIYLYVNDTLISPNETISSLYDHYHDKDNILYIAYSDINDTSFGPRIPKSSSEVYLQTESPTTAPTTTPRLLTSSESFITELTSTGRSHTEIKTPKLTTTASTTTAFSETTLLEGTTESLSEKLLSTKLTARTAITEMSTTTKTASSETTLLEATAELPTERLSSTEVTATSTITGMPTATKTASLETTLPEATTGPLMEKPSSTEVTATSTIAGMPTTAAVATEQTSLKSSVPLTEELASTTAITTSLITAVPTITASISPLTTTVTPEAYETLMKYPYKEENPLENRKTEAADILRDNPQYVPVVIEKDPGSPLANYRSTNKPEPAMGNKTMEDLSAEIKNKINEDIIYLYVNDTLISPNETISSLYDHYHDKDNILYIAYSDINDTTFGPRISTSSLEVYLQTESPTTAPTTTATLLTSSESFITELTPTERSQTEIKIPKLTTTASTTTAFVETTLLEGTTESLPEKLSFTKLTARTTITEMPTITETASSETTLPEAMTESLTEKPSSTEVTAMSATTEMPSTAAVPSERTSLKASSVSLTEELASTRAITTSPITAVPTTIASISLPTTTVTAEAYETLMKYPYKEENPLENRKTEAADILWDKPDYVPVVIEKDPGSPLANYRITNKPEPVMGNKTIEELSEEIKNKINEDIIYLYVNDTLISPNETISSLYDHYHDKDNILYIAYSDINDTTFGPRISTSSSEVYLQTEFPTTASTTTATLLTSSESFITELIPTERSQTEIKIPKLTTTASTTTAFLETTLLKGTTESLPEKLSFTKLTARTTITEMPTITETATSETTLLEATAELLTERLSSTEVTATSTITGMPTATKTASLETTLPEATTESLTEKPSSTEVTATSTIAGMPTTAAVATEQTSLKSSVLLTEELTSTTAIIASPIPAVPTITASISLPTTTVTAEAYETLMKYPYKEENPLENRKNETADILRDNPEYVPVVIEKDPGSPLANYCSTNKPEPVIRNKTIEDLSEEIKNKINEDIIYLYVNDTLISPNETISSLYDHYHDKDNILYIAYSDINDTTFGPRISTSSSEVYLQTESPTTAFTTTATLLTSSGSFSTEVTSTARSHTEIITPTLLTTESTTTASAETTLVEATTELPTEKLSSTEVTATSTITRMPTATKTAFLETTLPEATTEPLTEKPSSTEVTAASTLTGMPTTAAVPTERTLLKSSVPVTEKLTPTTAITASISLPTTTVTPEAYETLMKYPYKEENPLQIRKTEAADILRDNPDCVPVVIEKDPGSLLANYRSTNKPEPVMGNKTMEDLSEEIKNKINEDIVYLYVNDTLISPNETISSLYDHYHDKDNILYIVYSDINDTTFGPRIPKSSSEVYLQTESPTTAPTTTATLLTSSGSFSTEVTSTARSHTKIITPTLTTTASTATASAETTLLEATTELPTKKLSSTEGTATSTITGMLTTAAVPTERTSLKSSVPLTEEITSTTAVTASPITAVPTITASISLPTTTVTPEAYETLMKYPYKEENPLQIRKTEAADILRDNPDYIPVVIEKDPGSPFANYRSTNKPEPVMGNKTIEELTEEIQNKLNEDIIYLYVNDTLISPNETISSLYDHYHDKDNILYIAYSDINDTTFGPRIPKSSSEVYLQTESPTTAPTTTPRLLTLSESFITELTSTGRSHTEIKTPKLTTTASTTTAFSETTLLEGTTESLSEKPSSTEVTATSTIAGMPTTAAVPTEQTSLKSSVLLTELTSTTAIIASPITAVPTITASISLPTTTVTAYETLMKYPYKEENPLQYRKTEAADILRDNLDYVPVVIEKDPGSPLANYRSTNKPEPVIRNKTIEDLSEEIKNKLNEDIVYLYVNDTLISPNETISSLYDHYHDKDNILYIAYSDINDTTFGPRIFKSSSEVYIQTESPTTAPTTAATLLTSSESFMTERTFTARLHTEIITPTLSTAASTTTTSLETTLPEATTESLTEKPSSTEVTAMSATTEMPSTAAVPTERTSLKASSVSLIEELASTTALTTSPITAVPTTIASISLPTTTVTAEAYETLMKYPYKEENPLENRKTEAADILWDKPDYVPVVIEKDPGFPLANYRSTNKPEPVMGNKTIEELSEEIKNKLNEDIIYLYVNDTLISPNETISSLYDHYQDKDNILYIAYSDINDTSFGPRISTSSSEVYLQLSSPTATPTTTTAVKTTPPVPMSIEVSATTASYIITGTTPTIPTYTPTTAPIKTVSLEVSLMARPASTTVISTPTTTVVPTTTTFEPGWYRHRERYDFENRTGYASHVVLLDPGFVPVTIERDIGAIMPDFSTTNTPTSIWGNNKIEYLYEVIKKKINRSGFYLYANYSLIPSGTRIYTLHRKYHDKDNILYIAYSDINNSTLKARTTTLNSALTVTPITAFTKITAPTTKIPFLTKTPTTAVTAEAYETLMYPHKEENPLENKKTEAAGGGGGGGD